MAEPQPGGTLRRLDPQDLGDHLDRLFRAAWALCGDRHEAEDLVQDTYARVLARPRWLRSDDDLGYLLRALRNTHLARRRAGARRPLPAELGDLPDESGRGAPDAAADARALFAAINTLSPPFRDALIAVDLVGLTYREAALALRTREATITTRLHRARRRVADALGDPEAGR